ncbi:CAAX prenyl protease 2 putativepeptidase with unknown catalytic mechanism (family U48) [Leptomonas pyrrhocoris]|uniref:intramembrane prenyl-peptidase Rce1 n=1 Tax=Leptomonas pyrrhocoris TaxID=157538 RepID=A0A0N0DR65_LEPPY|nr:CAAX prenyl protease 2 putativepeptidase with unknown catalytic mechanism (family U48) [Leptomonas pyrrhocoris]KPA74041.1 CAAX prenyl protease 2 putativepeptidase with unknown catalytic mechanism (family U48) [Leptomonas pyrrhocoris]|eukprot:XP_015652480.1 CAAX prenyl protease 2 putativepeptidase with unknown catalytic mechanism (family U48) [Leptomonas pyrrhocoris]
MDCLRCAGASVTFIASFYLWPSERRFVYWGVRSLRRATEDNTIYIDRDSDDTIRRRTLFFLQNCVLSAGFLAFQSHSSLEVPAYSGGVWLLPLSRATVSTLVLFAGPVGDKIILRKFPIEENWLRRWRSYVLCPIGEELFFRGVLFTLLSKRSQWMQIGVATLLFSLSHSHHIVSWACDEYIDRCADATESSDADLQCICWRAAARKLVSVYLFTGAFGALSGYYYLCVCEGSIGAIAAVHAICNFIGPPDFAVLRSPSVTRRIKVVSAVMHVGGIVGWLWALLH